MSDRLEKLRARIAAAEAARDAVRASISDEDREEMELRKALKRAEEERQAEERTKREDDLEKREEAARELYPQAKICSLCIKGYDDTFVLMHSPKAHAQWQKGMTDSIAGNKKLDREDVSRAYAVAVVIDWNGITDYGPTSLNGHALIEFLKKHPGMVTPITNAAMELAGACAEERKS